MAVRASPYAWLAVGVGLGFADQFADHPGDVAFAEQQEAEVGGQRAFVRPAEVDLRRLADVRQLQGDRRDRRGRSRRSASRG